MSNYKNKEAEIETLDGIRKLKFVLLSVLFFSIYTFLVYLLAFVFEDHILRAFTGGYQRASFGLGINNVASSIRAIATLLVSIGIIIVPFMTWKKFFIKYGENTRPVSKFKTKKEV